MPYSGHTVTAVFIGMNPGEGNAKSLG